MDCAHNLLLICNKNGQKPKNGNCQGMCLDFRNFFDLTGNMSIYTVLLIKLSMLMQQLDCPQRWSSNLSTITTVTHVAWK